MKRRTAALAALALLAVAYPGPVLALLGWYLTNITLTATLTACGLLAYAYPRHTRRAAKAIGIGAMITAHAIRPTRTTRPTPTPAPEPATA